MKSSESQRSYISIEGRHVIGIADGRVGWLGYGWAVESWLKSAPYFQIFSPTQYCIVSENKIANFGQTKWFVETNNPLSNAMLSWSYLKRWKKTRVVGNGDKKDERVENH